MEKVKLGLCQMKVVDNKQQNIKRAIAMITKASENGANLAILPEMFNCPYENEKFVEYCEVRDSSFTLNSISSIAKEKSIHVLAGSIPEKVIVKDNVDKVQEYIYNTSFLFDNNGKILGFHRKMHLFDIDIEDKLCFNESDTLKAGNKVTVIDTKFGKIGIAICYDIRFMELSRLMTLKGAKILIFPGAFNLTTGPAHWKLLFQSRAIDNQVFTVGVSSALNKDSSYESYGHSIVCNPWGEAIAQGKYDEELIIAEIDLNELAKIRKELPTLSNRRSDVYELKLKNNNNNNNNINNVLKKTF